MKKIYSILLCIGLVASFVACEKDKDFALTTLSVANETITPWYESAQVSCSFKADATISEACVQYALSSSFVEYKTAEMAEEKGVYSAQLTDLQSDTMYYVRYVVSNKYSQVVSEAVVDFRTLQPVVPIVVLDTVSEVWDHRAIAQMRLVFNGGAAVTDLGICWGTQPQPTMKDIHRSTDDTLALIDITSLQPNTKYYARAYAVNKVGVAYSEEKEFVTLTQPEVRTDEVRDIELTSAVLVGKLLFNGNDTATIKGFCWGEKAVPTVDDDQVAIDTLTDEYSYLLSNLKDETQYFVRAYAKNKIGVVYGEERVFTTQAAVAPKVVTKEVKDVDDQSATVQGEVTSDGGAEVTERGVVYGTSENPTVENSKVTSGAGIGAFTCNLTGLQPNTKYYVRAYAVNKKGTAYGEQVNFTTLEEVSATPEYVDLGLSVKWADRNVGATKPEDYGDYFAWGETEPKEVYDWSTYIWCNGSYTTQIKYCTNSSYGTVDNKTQLELSDDAAHANWGGDWRMPTQAEQDELINNCTWTWTTQNGVNGYKVTSKSNGNSIFLPAAGRRYGGSLDPAGSSGYYWSSSLNMDYPNGAWYVKFSSDGVYRYDLSRYYGFSVRPVYGEYIPAINLPVITTGVVTQITETTAVAGGNVTSDGGANVTERGVVYGTSENPTVENSKVVGGSGTGMFTCNLTGLQPNTKYYVRAYAVNSKGTAYGEQVSFTTLEEVKTTAEYVDLGLSVKWATVNVGATKPEEYGDYFAWGETEPKSTYNWSTYKWCNGSETTLTKYCTDGSYGTVDNKTQLELSDDASHVNWGSDWRIPTDAELNELVNECTWTWIAQNGVKGYKVIGSNGNSIFLPAAGFRSNSDELTSSETGNSGVYASRTLVSFGPSYSLYLFFDNENKGWSTMYRYVGYTIRPVYGAMPENSLASVTSSAVTQITETTAVAGGKVTADGGSIVLECGVVYSTSQNPTTDDKKVTSDDGSGDYTCNITGLQASTTYYVRAYAVNSKGTAYGEQVSFTTLEEVKTTAEYVDLGLSVKWATVNVGATKPEEYGDYFAWGETAPKEVYDWSTYKWCNGSETTLTKYCTDGSYGTVDNKAQLELSDDAAHANWGGDWRMPTDAELTELRENCTWTWTTQNGVNGYKVTGTNGNSIFLPAAGCRLASSLYSAGSHGLYWSSSLSTGSPYYACRLSFGPSGVDWNYNYRCCGQSVRPVYGEYVPESTLPVVTTGVVTQITETTAVAGGNVTSDGGASVTERGVVYGISENPTVGNSKVVGGSGTGTFTCNLTGLQPNTKYYVRAYAVNSQGTAYGEQVSFTTLEEVKTTAEYVDLGLSVKWATCNVGATKPEEYGDYFAWGETEPKEVYDWSTYKWCNGSETTLTKYCTDGSYGTVDNKTQLELSDDAAHANWGGDWRMPTKAERDELCENCTWTWTTQNGVNGYKVISKSNGNSIFLPAAGFRNGSSLSNAGSNGTYWPSSLSTYSPDYACLLYFYSSSVDRYSGGRYYGHSVRPVYGEYVPAINLPMVTTSTITQITETTAVAGGNVTADGGASVTERGVVYSTSENPTTANSKVVGGSGTGAFTCNLTGLQASTTYYVRAYAINEKGTAYGEQVSFTTLEEVSATPEYVDLGLSVKWATFNVGATKPEEYGDYFAWGETEPKEVYDLSTYVWYNDSEYTLTKYNNSSDQGTVDNKTQLELSDDAAHVNWGGDWRMPTHAEQDELRNNCTWTWTTQNGVNGYKVTSNKSGYTNKSIFLPAAGYHYDSSLNNAGSFGYYWSSSLSTDRPFQAYELEFESGFVEWMNIDDRCGGRSVRPVYGEYVPPINLPVIITDVVTKITETTAVAGGNVTSDGGIASVTERGVVYGTSENPTVENSKVTSGAGIGAFTCNLADLQVGTTYYVRAYAVNSQGTAYGEQVSFTTLTPSNGMENGYEWVDLGLSVKWATINVGATKPEEYGDYFAWGETEPKNTYDWSTYKWCNGSYDTQTKYCTKSIDGSVDNKTQLELSDDAAHVNWGGSWRMPTAVEFTELRENCTWTWTTQNGVNGYKVTGTNGNSIFLPAAGYRGGSSLLDAGSYGYYWSSSLNTYGPSYAYNLRFYSSLVDWNDFGRCYGLSVRPVCQ